MGDEPRFSEKWDFRRQENNFDDDSSSDDPDSYSTHEPIIHNTDPVLDSNHLDNGTKTVSTEQPVKTRKRRSKKDESKPEKAKQVRKRKPKTVCAEENTKKKETVMETDEVGMFMKTLLDDLTASRESLMNWMNTELNGSSDQHVSRPPPKKRAVAAGPVKKRRTKTKGQEEKESEKQRKQGEICQEMIKTKEKGSEVVQNGGDQAQQLDYDVGTLDMFLRSGLEQGQQGIVEQTEIENATTMNEKKSVVLAIEAPKLRQRQKKASTIKNRSETKKDDNFAIPYVPQLSSSPTLQSFPVGSSLFPSSSQGVTSLASNHNFQPMQPPVVPQFSDLYEFQTGFTGGQGYDKSSPFHNNGYFSGFPAASQPNLMAQRDNNNIDNNNMFGELQMAIGAIPYSGSRFPESEAGNGNYSLSDYRTSSGR
ncbi:BnaA04g11070D [Brassica napus]|uniref:BnaA04g11070D protein n=1 Tax=Brassica napus TaxID=3708 RepID=A0A078HQ48_BRANA|nr:BnaA04g11070D [Brassica napus]